MIFSKRCLICGYKFQEREQMHYDYPLCPICNDDTLIKLLHNLVNEAEKRSRAVPFIACEADPLFSFLADLGMFATTHPFLKTVKEVMVALPREYIRIKKKRFPFRELQKYLPQSRPSKRIKRLRQIIEFFFDVGFIKYRATIDGYKVPFIDEDSILFKVFITTEHETKLQRASSMVFGYSLLKGIIISIEWIRKEKLKEEPTGERRGILRLYPERKDKKLMILKEVTAPIMFFLFVWANNIKEFSEFELKSFLAFRGISGEKANAIRNWLKSLIPGAHHKMIEKYREEYIGESMYTRFYFNPEYLRLRERFRERERLN